MVSLNIESARALRAHIKRELDNKVEVANKAKIMSAASARSGRLFQRPTFQEAPRDVKPIIKREAIQFPTSFVIADLSRSLPCKTDRPSFLKIPEVSLYRPLHV